MTKTIKCRIALCVDPKGSWVAGGSDACVEDDAFYGLADTLEPGESCYWVEVEVPVPDAEPPTVQGKATEV